VPLFYVDFEETDGFINLLCEDLPSSTYDFICDKIAAQTP